MKQTVAEKVYTIREQLAERIGSEKFKTWFGDSTEFNLTVDRLNVSVKNRFTVTQPSFSRRIGITIVLSGSTIGSSRRRATYP